MQAYLTRKLVNIMRARQVNRAQLIGLKFQQVRHSQQVKTTILYFARMDIIGVMLAHFAAHLTGAKQTLT